MLIGDDDIGVVLFCDWRESDDVDVIDDVRRIGGGGFCPRRREPQRGELGPENVGRQNNFLIYGELDTINKKILKDTEKN